MTFLSTRIPKPPKILILRHIQGKESPISECWECQPRTYPSPPSLLQNLWVWENRCRHRPRGPQKDYCDHPTDRLRWLAQQVQDLHQVSKPHLAMDVPVKNPANWAIMCLITVLMHRLIWMSSDKPYQMRAVGFKCNPNLNPNLDVSHRVYFRSVGLAVLEQISLWLPKR